MHPSQPPRKPLQRKGGGENEKEHPYRYDVVIAAVAQRSAPVSPSWPTTDQSLSIHVYLWQFSRIISCALFVSSERERGENSPVIAETAASISSAVSHAAAHRGRWRRTFGEALPTRTMSTLFVLLFSQQRQQQSVHCSSRDLYPYQFGGVWAAIVHHGAFIVAVTGAGGRVLHKSQSTPRR